MSKNKESTRAAAAIDPKRVPLRDEKFPTGQQKIYRIDALDAGLSPGVNLSGSTEAVRVFAYVPVGTTFTLQIVASPSAAESEYVIIETLTQVVPSKLIPGPIGVLLAAQVVSLIGPGPLSVVFIIKEA